MFHYDRGLFLTKPGLGVDVRRRQLRGFISHAHVDHMARHQMALCTPATAMLYQSRYGKRDVLEMPYRVPLEFGGLTLTTYPAGHCLGSAMLLAEAQGTRFLYSGDFKLGKSLSCEEAELPQADLLVIESTYGKPQYRLKSREEAAQELIEVVHKILRQGKTPVVEAYVLGKGQEITCRLTAAGIPVLQHKAIYEISQVYEACGVSLGNYRKFEGLAPAGHAIVMPPSHHRVSGPQVHDGVRIAVTGWAHDPGSRRRLGVDYAIAFSDHADYDQLFEAIARVSPREIYCTHGPECFVEDLRSAGYQAFSLDKAWQKTLPGV